MKPQKPARRESARRKTDADGKVICSCGCGRHPVPPRRNWFSEDCVTAWKEINDPAYIRQKLFDRDQGICARCGCDSNAEFRRYRAILMEASRLANHFSFQRHLTHRGKNTTEEMRLEAADRTRIVEYWTSHLPKWTIGRNNGWDADHIIPVCEGGGQCGLDNYRTLCHPCHKTVTAELAARRAGKTTDSLQPELL